MEQEILESISKNKIVQYTKIKQLGRILNLEGSIEILTTLRENPKRYQILENELDTSPSTLQRRLRDLRGLQLIKQNPITSENRNTHEYTLTIYGNELMKFLINYERKIMIPSVQKAIISFENEK